MSSSSLSHSVPFVQGVFSCGVLNIHLTYERKMSGFIIQVLKEACVRSIFKICVFWSSDDRMLVTARTTYMLGLWLWYCLCNFTQFFHPYLITGRLKRPIIAIHKTYHVIAVQRICKLAIMTGLQAMDHCILQDREDIRGVESKVEERSTRVGD